MAVERRDPLPPGRYWVFLTDADLDRWKAWTREHGVRTLLTEGLSGGGHHVVFDVKTPAPWVGFGFPTIVEAGTLPTTEQTIQAPAPLPGMAERLEAGLDRAWSDIKTAAVVGLLAWMALNFLKKR